MNFLHLFTLLLVSLSCTAGQPLQSSPAEKAFINAVKEGRIAEVRDMLSKKTVSVNTRLTEVPPPVIYRMADEAMVEGGTALEVACAFNRSEELVKLLLDNGAQVDAVDTGLLGMKRTALVWAAEKGRLDLIKLLVAKKANVNFKDQRGSDALLYATRAGRLDIVEYLLANGANLNTVDGSGAGVMVQAAITCNTTFVRYFLRKGTTPNQHSAQGDYPIFMCPESFDMLQLLVENGADVNVKIQNMYPVIKRMVDYFDRNPDAIEYLIAHGADVNATDHLGETTMQQAAWALNYDIVSLLLSKNASCAPDASGWTPLIRVASSYSTSIEKKFDMIQLLTSGCDNINAADKNGDTFFSVACKYAPISLPLIKYSIENASVNVNYVNNDGENCLLQAVNALMSDVGNVVKYLIRKGANVNQRNTRKETPLLAALRYTSGNAEMFKDLINAGADVNAVNADGKGAMDLALEQRSANDEIVQLLQQKGAVTQVPPRTQGEK